MSLLKGSLKSFIHSKDFHLIIISTPISASEYADLVSRTQSIVAVTLPRLMQYVAL